jgi:hypothetical protein
MQLNFLNWFGGRLCGVSGLRVWDEGDGNGNGACSGLRC